MNLVGKQVRHKIFGEGKIMKKNNHIIEINFSGKQKRFIFPDAFSRFITIMDEEGQVYISAILNDIAEKERRIQEEEKTIQERLQRIRSLKVTSNSQAAFGFFENNYNKVFDSWSIFTGSYLSGDSKGQPRVPTRLKLNSACLLTERPVGRPEEERCIIGAFMVKDDFEGNHCKDGMIESHETYRIALNKPNEKMMFWDYFSSTTQLPKWGNREMKYFSNTTMQEILKDMKKVIIEPKRKETIAAFYQYFCEVNRLNELGEVK